MADTEPFSRKLLDPLLTEDNTGPKIPPASRGPGTSCRSVEGDGRSVPRGPGKHPVCCGLGFQAWFSKLGSTFP